ncbi:hypothetical protein ECL_B042 (plasmid) [Enterobacter cloacae subsp. cloacae ATCC 13047]|uniref:Uncharacterized protein n=1 Tax=Enterobacter cloacae subsp. cloacae (strain ATCC 13047 / DSM 30054 / NBRC 13535 / NCTC 10005 / WDCM 00083 / NCDC 279-56) TaxID=716541 RepID=A0A0H3CUQ9_ENTCC|nr:hypothetical protein ECL_B042 [Enterobacter cloacae subsp. cloacae ATCC 13047]OOC92399.1 hypothetical protein BWP06_03935 [Enterobacter cloacae]
MPFTDITIAPERNRIKKNLHIVNFLSCACANRISYGGI